MLYEKSRVSKYERKDRPGKVKTQINLGLNSEFKKDNEVVVIYLDNFEDMEKKNKILICNKFLSMIKMDEKYKINYSLGQKNF